ncbi:MAG: PPOX class F420-dependent oxidoreductase [Ilumatobacteraceae bacterium]
MPADLDAARYVSFTTHRRDGTPVSLPVWIVPFDGGYAFTTDPGSAKVRRIANDARATLRVCDIRGRVADGTTEHAGSAVLLGPEDTERVATLVRRKYRFGWMLISAMAVLERIRGKGRAAEGAIKVTLD